MTSATHRNKAASSPGRGSASYVMGDVDVGVVHPLRSAEIQRLCAQDLPEPRHRQYAFGEARGERVEVGHRSSKDG